MTGYCLLINLTAQGSRPVSMTVFFFPVTFKCLSVDTEQEFGWILLGGILLGTKAKGQLGKGVENAGKGIIIMMDHEI